MRIVQAGGEHLRRKASFLTRVLALLAWVAIVAGLVFWSRPLILVPVLSGLLLLALKTWHRRASWRKGTLGEQLITTLLDRLPDDYVLVNDVALPQLRGNVDHVLIGPPGVLVIETKHYAGNIYCNGDWWWVNRQRRRSISKQANAAAATLREHLASRHPDLKDSALRYVRAAVVFTNPLCRLEVRNARVIVARYSELLPLIKELERENRLDAAAVKRLGDGLVSLHAA